MGAMTDRSDPRTGQPIIPILKIDRWLDSRADHWYRSHSSHCRKYSCTSCPDKLEGDKYSHFANKVRRKTSLHNMCSIFKTINLGSIWHWLLIVVVLVVA